LFVVRK